MAHLHRAAADRIQHFEGRDQFAPGEDLDLQPTIRCLFDSLRKVLNANAKPR